MKSDMILIFAHPCNGCLDFEDTYFKRTIPQAGTTKKRVDFGENNFKWTFTQNGYTFCLEHREDNGCPKFVLSYSENPSDPWDWSEIEDCSIIYSTIKK